MLAATQCLYNGEPRSVPRDVILSYGPLSRHAIELKRVPTVLRDVLVSYPTLSAGRHFIRRLPGSGKDCTQNRCTVLA